MTVSVEARSNYFRSLTNLIAFHFRMKISHLLLIFSGMKQHLNI